MRRRIFASICTIALGSVLLLAACVVGLVYQQATQNGWNSLAANAATLAAGLETGGDAFLQRVRGYPGRITLIGADGRVLFDDREDAALMENHAGRPEVRQALESGEGRAQRQSDTLSERTLYYALRLSDGRVLRLSVQAASAVAEAGRFVPWLGLVALLTVAAAAAVARWQTKRIVAPVNAIDLDRPFETGAYEELSPLLRRIAAQKEQIDGQVEELRQRREEFATITESMDEGLIVTNHEGRVLTLNASARRLLGVADEEGETRSAPPLLALRRNLALDSAAKQAAEGRRVEDVLALDGRQYRLVGSPTRGQGTGRGAVLLLMDDTERLEAEESRREFSANVSHELKTPLTSISGYAELIRDGVARPDDVAGFAGKIYDEAARLIALVEDIIQLSRLDEKQVPAPREEVELLALARRVAEGLEKTAEGREVALVVEGQPTAVKGVRTILEEVLYNLMENAIRYNVAGGRVEIQVGTGGAEAFIEVADTGVGIPPQHQGHIFERFYRVDKSHSRQSGGTGLGLSIVKRGALFHGGRVVLASRPGRGSTFTVWLPLEGPETTT